MEILHCFAIMSGIDVRVSRLKKKSHCLEQYSMLAHDLFPEKLELAGFS